jgi:protein-L-isoaspartate(D-aspartate) O-methyltransferase
LDIKTNNKFLEQRRVLVSSLKAKGIENEKVLDAILALPRELFVLPAYLNKAYDDTALPIEYEQTISQPYTVAYMSSLLNVQTGDRILEIGTGSGYQACVLNLMGAKVFSIERIIELYDLASKRFKDFGFNIITRWGDGSLGWKEFAPFDGIIVTAAAPKVPDKLKEQLKIGGRLVVPVGDKYSQIMVIIERESETDFREYHTDAFKFVPLIGRAGWESE